MKLSDKFNLKGGWNSPDTVQVLEVTADKLLPFRPLLDSVAAMFPQMSGCSVIDLTHKDPRFDGATGRPAYSMFIKLREPVPYGTAFAMAHEFHERGVAWCFHADEMLPYFGRQ